jgi:hypothetical protein
MIATTPALGILAVCVEVAALLESDPTARDDAHARPAAIEYYTARRLYVWPRRDVFNVDGTGGLDLEHVYLRAGWVVPSVESSGIRLRSVSDEINSKADSFAALVRGARTGRTYEHLEIEQVDYEALVGIDTRGILVDLHGYYMRSDR